MNPGKRKSLSGDELIYELVGDPFYGVRHIRTDTGEPFVDDPASSEKFLIQVRPDQHSNKRAEEHPGWEYDPSLVVLHEINSEETESILGSIYKDKSKRQIFKNKFNRLPCKSDLLRHLVYSWCGLLWLPYTRNGQPPNNQEIDILENWLEDFEILLEDLRIFLRNNGWPLPISIFGEVPDNTVNKMNFTDEQFQMAYQIKVVLLNQCRQQLKELEKIQPTSIDEQERKIKKVDELKAFIQAIVDSEITNELAIKSNSRRVERSIETQSRYLFWHRQYLDKKQKNPGMSDVWISQQIAKQLEGKMYSSETIRKRMKSNKSWA